MILFILICFSISLLNRIDLLSYLANTILTFHSYCLSSLPQSQEKPLLEALICGRNLPNEPIYSALQSTGLLHLIVVSGSHLIFVEHILKKIIPHKTWARSSLPVFLLLYALMTAFQPPILKALIHRILESFSQKKGLHWTPLFICYASAWLCLALFPQWNFSLSFQLSWMASLSLATHSPLKNSFFSHFKVYILLFPLLADLSPPHPLSILINSVAIPLFGNLLIPLSLIHWTLGNLGNLIFDPLWQLLTQLITQISEKLPPLSTVQSHTSPWWKTAYVHSMSLFFIFLERKR